MQSIAVSSTMRCSFAAASVIAFTSITQVLSYSIGLDQLQARGGETARRSFAPVDSYFNRYFKRQGGNAFSGSSGDASGGSVINRGGLDGTVSSTGNSCKPFEDSEAIWQTEKCSTAIGGAGGFSTSGNARGGNGNGYGGGSASSGDAGAARGGSISVTGGNITSDTGSNIGGAGGNSTSGSAIGGDDDGDFDFSSFSDFDFDNDFEFEPYTPYIGFAN